MSEISDLARVQMFLADHAVSDASNKINALGVGFQLAVAQPTGVTSPQAVVVLVEVPPGHEGEELAFELALYDDADALAQAPAPMGGAGMPVRFAQVITLQPSVMQIDGLRIPRDAMWSRHQVVAAFQNGVPVSPGRGYEWRVSIDTATRPDWSCGFYGPGPSSGFVVG